MQIKTSHYYYYYYYFTPLEFFTSVLADGFSLKSEWQQVSSGLQDLSQDSDHIIIIIINVQQIRLRTA